MKINIYPPTASGKLIYTMELIKASKNGLKEKVRLLYQSYGHLCATRPLPMILSSVTLVVLCSLPLFSHPVFERTATFLFGRIQIGKYQTNVTLASDFPFEKPSIVIQQLHFQLNATVLNNEKLKTLDTWTVFQRSLEKSGMKNLQTNLTKGGWWMSACLHVSRKPFYKSPQTRLIYPRGRFYKELRKWFSKGGCLLVSPLSILGIKSRRFSDLPDPFKELLIGVRLSESGLSSPLKFADFHQFQFTVSFFMKKLSSSSLSRAVKDDVQSQINATVGVSSESKYRISYMPLDNESDIELIMLSFTYVLVFVYILFSVGKSDMLKSRWGLAFSALMTIIMSMMMALGICAALDLLPTTLTITEIFPYIVIVIGLENVMVITKSVVSIERDIDVSARVAKGMGKEGWYITKNICAELAILGAGYYTHIPSVQEFCIFAFVGVLSDFFLQMVFFAPILAVDIRRAEICHLEQITTVQQFAVGFNLMQKTALKLVPPSPPKTRWSKFLDLWLKRRMFQKALMAAALAYIIYAVYYKVETSKHAASHDYDHKHVTAAPAHGDMTTSEQETPVPRTKANVKHSLESLPASLEAMQKTVKKDVLRGDFSSEDANDNETVSWKFLSKQHWPELLSFYHIPFNERTLVVLPTIDVSMSLHLNETDQYSSYKFTKASKNEDFLSILSFAALILGCIYVLVLLFTCVSRRRRKLSSLLNDTTFVMEKKLLKGHKHYIDMLITEGSYVVSTSLDGSVRVWDVKTAECVLEIQSKVRNGERRNSNSTLRNRRFQNTDGPGTYFSLQPIRSVWCIDCKHNMIAIGYCTGIVEVYNITGKRLIAKLHEEEVVVTLKIASRNTVVIGRYDGILDIMEVKRNQMDSVGDFDFGDVSPRGERNHLDTFGCNVKHRVRSHIGPVENVAVFAGLVLAAAAETVKIYEIDDANCCNTIASNGKKITCLHELKECTTQSVAIGYEDGSVSLISITGEKCYEYSIHDSPVLFICSNSKQLASLDCSNRIFVWSTEERYECVELEDTPTDVESLHFLDEFTLSVVSTEGVAFYEPTSGKQSFRYIDPTASKENRIICAAQKDSLSIARSKSVEYILFPNLSNDNSREGT